MAVLRITKEKLKEQLDKGEMVVLLDVRSHDSYNMSNIKIKGSLRKDPVAVKSWEREIPRDKPIITYCTWHEEHTSARVAQELMQLGCKDVRALQGGMTEWADAGYPMEPK